MSPSIGQAALIETRGLVKRFPGVVAVDEISFAVPPGACFGLLGPNGAGKTTTLEMLEGIAQPDAGAVLYRGQPLDREFRERIGIQFQVTALQDHQTVAESLAMFSSFYQCRADIDVLVERCDLSEFLDRDTRKLSGGQRQRLLLAIALINDPDLVFLDEPTTGLDPQSRRNFWRLIEEIRQSGKTVILTTHYMEEAQRLCDDIAIIDRGRIIARGAPSDLLREHFPANVVRLADDGCCPDSGLPGAVERRDGVMEIYTDDVNAALSVLEEYGANLGDLHIGAPTLEDLFLKLTGHDLRA